MYDLIIIGGGPAGIAAGVYASRKRLKTVIIANEFSGQSAVSEDVQNWIGTISIPGKELAENMKKHLEAYANDVVDIVEGEKIKTLSKSDDGFVASFGTSWTIYGYRKEGYKSKHDFNIRAGTVGNIQFSLNNQWHHILGKWDIGFKTKYGHYFPYYNFFGVGNDTKKDDILYPNDYYKVRIRGLMAELFTEREIFKKGYLGVKSLYESFDSDHESGIISENVVNGIPGNERIILGGINTRFYLDLRDRKVFATRGLQFLIENTSYTTIDGESGNFGLTESYLKYYGTAKILLPTTLVLKIGGSKNYGTNIPFYKYTYLGQFNSLRGYRRNRFTGDASAYLNSELRFHFGDIKNAFLPFELGLIAFQDLGKVWFDGKDQGGWHKGYGGGFYIAPIARDYTFSFLIATSEEENLLFRFGLGFGMDR